MKHTFPAHLIKNKFIKSRLSGIRKDEMEDFFLSHALPDSIKAIKEFFLSVGIKSTGYKLPKEKVDKISCPFIAQLNNPNEFVLVDEIKNDKFKITTSKKTKKKYSSDSFYSRWNGIVLSLDLKKKLLPSARWSDKEAITNRLDNIIIIFLFLLIPYPFFRIINDSNFSSLIALTLVATSLYFSYTLLRLENGNKSHFEEKICYANSRFDCQEVINSKISRPFNFISLAELGIILFSFFYFLVLCTSFVKNEISLTISFICFFCLIISPFSISLILFQILKIKKICPFCSLIQLSILFCGTLFFINPLHFDSFLTKNYLHIVVSLLFAICFTFILIIYYSREKISKELISYHSLKHSRIAIEALLEKNPKLLLNNDRIVLKSRSGSPEIIFALNLKCKHCYKALQEYKHMLETIPNIGLGITFIVYSDTVKEIGGFVEKIESIYNNNDSSWFDMIDKWYLDSKFRIQNSNIKYNETNLETHLAWSFENNIFSSPTIIINNQLWPQELSVIDFSDYTRSMFS